MRKRLAIGLLTLLLAASAMLMSGCGAHKVIYDGNGNTGGNVPVDTIMYRAGQNVTVLDNTGGLVKTGHIFMGWSTQPDGSGTTYTAGQTLTMRTSDVILYAKWADQVAHVYYDGNGSTGGSVPADPNEYQPDQIATVLDNTGGLVKTGHVFMGWNTYPDGSGTTYTAGQTLTMGTSDITLHAKWAYRIGYIYKPGDADDAAAATTFETLLDPVYPLDKIDMSSLATTDLTQYAALILGRNAFLLTADQANLIKNTNLPVIGINRGGTSYFEKIGLSMKGANVASYNIAGAVVVDNTLTIWNKPNALGASNGDTVTVLTASSQTNVLYSGYLTPGTVHVARCPGSLAYDAIAIEGNNLYWAYYNDPSTFTETGKKLFVNAIHHMVSD